MVSSAIWENFSQIAREIIPLLVYNIKGHVRQSIQLHLHRDRSPAVRPNFRVNYMFIFSMYKSKVDGTP